jgi:urea transport system permease protein
MDVILDILLQGIAVGSTFLLGALGLTIIYGVMGVVNLAHGEFIMLGAYVVALLAGSIPLGLAMLAAVLVLGAIGYLVDFSLIRFLYHKPVASMLGTWGLGMVLRQGTILLFGPELRYVAVPVAGTFSVAFGVTYSVWRACLVAASVATAVAVWLIITRSAFGLKMRAVIGNPDVAESLGLRVERVNRWAFALGIALAGIAGALISPLRTVFPGMGLPFLVGAFLVVILAGLGNVRATVVWSMLIGLGTAAVSIPVSDITAQISIWAAALIIIAFRRDSLTVARV